MTIGIGVRVGVDEGGVATGKSANREDVGSAILV